MKRPMSEVFKFVLSIVVPVSLFVGCNRSADTGRAEVDDPPASSAVSTSASLAQKNADATIAQGTKAATPVLGEWLGTPSDKQSRQNYYRFFEDGRLEIQGINSPRPRPYLYKADYSKSPIALTLIRQYHVWNGDEILANTEEKATFSILGPGKAELQFFGEGDVRTYALSLNSTKTSKDLLTVRLARLREDLVNGKQSRASLAAVAPDIYQKDPKQFWRGKPKTQQELLNFYDEELRRQEAEIEAVSAQLK